MRDVLEDLGRKVLKIKPWVVFRPLQFKRKLGLLVKNLNDNSHYELKGRAAYLWLLIDGSRTVDEIILSCRKTEKVKDPKFTSLSRKFLKDILDASLVFENSSFKRDERAEDMKEFFRHIRSGPSEKSSLVRKKRLRSEVGDKAAILAVRKRFSKLLQGKIKLQIKRTTAPFSGAKVHVFEAELKILDQVKMNIQGLGASLTLESAAIGAIGEAVERASIENIEPMINIRKKSYDELTKSGQRALDPESYRFYDGKQEPLLNGEIINLSRESKADWGVFEDSDPENGKILVPIWGEGSENTLFPQLLTWTSSGCAAHTDQNLAKLSGALELIERDNVLFYWRTKNTPQQIDHSTLPEHLRKLLASLNGLEKRIKLFYLKSELAPVTVQAVLLGKPSVKEPYFLDTAATRFNPADSVEKAIVELLYVLHGYRPENKNYYGKDFDNSIWDFDDRISFYGEKSRPGAYEFLFPSSVPPISFSDISSADKGNPEKNLKFLNDEFKRNDLRLFYKNVTLKALDKSGFFVYRAFSPDLIPVDPIHRYRALGHERYQKLSKLLNLKNKPSTIEELNKWPNPIC